MKCTINSVSCVYHACIGDGCQREQVQSNGRGFGYSDCEKFDAEADAREIIAIHCGNPPEKTKLEYTIWLNEHKVKFYTKNSRGTTSFHKKMMESYNALVQTAKQMLGELNQVKTEL
jgi:hypothetical protein